MGRACTPSVSMRVPPSMRVPRVHTYPFRPPPLDGPPPVDRDTSTGHARGVISHPPSLTTQKTKTKKKNPPLPLQKCTNKHTTGAVVVVFNPPEGPSDPPRAPACAMDNERCHVSEACGSCVPSTRTGHDSRKTTHDQPTARIDIDIDIGIVDAPSSLESRVGSARRACAFDSFDALGRARALDTLHHRLLADRRASETSRARETRTKTPRVDRRHRPTATSDDERRRRG